MHKVELRNYVLFVLLTLICSVALIYVFQKNYNAVDISDASLERSYDVLAELEDLNTNIIGLLGAQRGYIISLDDEFLKNYEDYKTSVEKNIESLKFSLSYNEASTEHLNTLTRDFEDALDFLEVNVEKYKSDPSLDSKIFVLGDLEQIRLARKKLLDSTQKIFDNQYDLLIARDGAMEYRQAQYFKTLILGIIITAILLIVFNGFLLRSQRQLSATQTDLEDTKNRLKHAVIATQDGIYDWYIKKNTMYFSQQFFTMLGDDGGEREGKIEDFKALIHPDDFEPTITKLEMFIGGKLSEFDTNYRMKHTSGRWVWIQSQARAIHNAEQETIRIVGAHTDISYQKQYEERILEEKSRAEQSSKAKSEFLAHMSHEIRTPLTAIIGIAEILVKQTDQFNERQGKLIRTLSSSTSSLKDLINDVLDFSRIESGEVKIEYQAFDLKVLLEDIISMMSVKALEKNIKFEIRSRKVSKKNYMGDPNRIRQVLVNLISNAIKFTDKGSVLVTVEPTSENENSPLRFKVKDSGIGIPEEKLNVVFERFKQADDSVSRSHGGTGLGLPISKNLAKMMNGEIQVESVEGEGSVFTLTLPLDLDKEEDLNDNYTPEVLKKINDKIKAQVDGKNKMLVVEDYEPNVIVISYLLEELNIEHDVVHNGEQAVQKFKEHHYDVILMDVQMPVMDGFEATQQIRNLESEMQIDPTPIIGMTAHAFISDRNQCIEAGMDEYLPKPIVEKDFKKTLLFYLKTQIKNKKKRVT